MANMNLDSIDLKLLAELQADGRITNVELATKVGLTAPPCLRRMRALEQSGTLYDNRFRHGQPQKPSGR
jgi:DNA-binding Lrp family transcriptional regulator